MTDSDTKSYAQYKQHTVPTITLPAKGAVTALDLCQNSYCAGVDCSYCLFDMDTLELREWITKQDLTLID